MTTMHAAGQAARTMVVDLEYWFTIVALLLITSSFNPIFYVALGDNSDSYTDSNPAKLATTCGVYLIATILLLRVPTAVIQVFKETPLVLVVLLLPLGSVLWSVDVSTTLKRAAAHDLTILFCIYAVTRFSAEKLLERLLVVVFIGGVASLAYTVISPTNAITQGAVNHGAWEGIYAHKNELGRVCSIALLLCVSCTPSTALLKKIRWATIVCFLVLLAFSQSRTNWLICFSGCCLLPVLRVLQLRQVAKWVRISVLVSSIAVLVLAVTFGADFILQSIGRDATLSGRETLWRGVETIVITKYWPLGAGYGAFFTPKGGLTDLALGYLQYWTIVPNHAHSGYVQTFADLGVPGEIVLALVIIVSLVRLTRKLMYEPTRKAWVSWMLMLFIFLINNYSESVAFKHSDAAWALVMMGLLYAGRQPAQTQAQRQRRGRGQSNLQPETAPS